MSTRKGPASQGAVDRFWSEFNTKTPGKVTRVLPTSSAKKAPELTYEQAAEACKIKVAKIIIECRRTNKKYADPHFDLELDIKWGERDTLMSLSGLKPEHQSGTSPGGGSEFDPKAAQRVSDIFVDPHFFLEGPSANDVRQGRNGDCWLLSAMCTLSNKPELIHRVCVARDEAVGVYGFVFFRDGEWIYEIIDDKLFLTSPDFYDSQYEKTIWEGNERVNPEKEYWEAYQKGSSALYYAHCKHPNETWVPLLEKAFAKAHGDYEAINGGYTGEAIEDLTGGVTTEIYTPDILDKERFWKELLKVNDEFLFGCSTGVWGNVNSGDRKGIKEMHAYSVMRSVETHGKRLVLVRDPIGNSDWSGPWSKGSEEWDLDWMKRLDYQFGETGSFWMAYEDLLKRFQSFDRTRLFGPDWKVASLWTTLSIPWTEGYHPTCFELTLTRSGPVVIVLSQLNRRYFYGLEGQYDFRLHFRLHKKGKKHYLVQSTLPFRYTRSVNADMDLEAGAYTVFMEIIATRDTKKMSAEEAVQKYAKEHRTKLLRIGKYDFAHRKAKPADDEEAKQVDKSCENDEREKEPQQEHLVEPPCSSSDGSGPLTPTETDSASSFEPVMEESETCVTQDSSSDISNPGPLMTVPDDEVLPSPDLETGEQAEEQYHDDPFAPSAWNAVVTVGLRVYCKVPEDDKDAEVVKLTVETADPPVEPCEGGSDDEDSDAEEYWDAVNRMGFDANTLDNLKNLLGSKCVIL